MALWKKPEVLTRGIFRGERRIVKKIDAHAIKFITDSVCCLMGNLRQKVAKAR
jgi:hypothetical protein